MIENETPPASSPQTPSSEHVRAEIVDDVRVMNANDAPYAGHNTAGLVLTEPSAFVALVFAVLSWIVLPIVGALVALGIAPGAKRRIRESNGRLGGRKLATAAQVIAVANLLAAVLVIYGLIALVRWIF
jgi:hypothetical protein